MKSNKAENQGTQNDSEEIEPHELEEEHKEYRVMELEELKGSELLMKRLESEEFDELIKQTKLEISKIEQSIKLNDEKQNISSKEHNIENLLPKGAKASDNINKNLKSTNVSINATRNSNHLSQQSSGKDDPTNDLREVYRSKSSELNENDFETKQLAEKSQASRAIELNAAQSKSEDFIKTNTDKIKNLKAKSRENVCAGPSVERPSKIVKPKPINVELETDSDSKPARPSIYSSKKIVKFKDFITDSFKVNQDEDQLLRNIDLEIEKLKIEQKKNKMLLQDYYEKASFSSEGDSDENGSESEADSAATDQEDLKGLDLEIKKLQLERSQVSKNSRTGVEFNLKSSSLSQNITALEKSDTKSQLSTYKKDRQIESLDVNLEERSSVKVGLKSYELVDLKELKALDLEIEKLKSERSEVKKLLSIKESKTDMYSNSDKKSVIAASSLEQSNKSYNKAVISVEDHQRQLDLDELKAEWNKSKTKSFKKKKNSEQSVNTDIEKAADTANSEDMQSQLKYLKANYVEPQSSNRDESYRKKLTPNASAESSKKREFNASAQEQIIFRQSKQLLFQSKNAEATSAKENKKLDEKAKLQPDIPVKESNIPEKTNLNDSIFNIFKENLNKCETESSASQQVNPAGQLPITNNKIHISTNHSLQEPSRASEHLLKSFNLEEFQYNPIILENLGTNSTQPKQKTSVHMEDLKEAMPSVISQEHPKAFDIMKLKDEASQLQLLDLKMRGLKLQNSTQSNQAVANKELNNLAQYFELQIFDDDLEKYSNNVMLEKQKIINSHQQKVNLNENEAKLDTPSDDEENYSETSSLEQLVIKMKPNVEVQVKKYSASVPDEKLQFNRPKVDRKEKVSEITETSLISEERPKFSMLPEEHPKVFDIMKLKDEASQLQLLDLKMRGLKLQNSTKSNQTVANKELNNSAQYFEFQIFDDDLNRSEAGHFNKSENKTLSQTNNDERINKLEAAVRGQKNIILRHVSSDSETHKELPASLEEYSNNVILENQKIINSQQQKVHLNENEPKLDTPSDDEENYSETSNLEQLVIKMKPNVEVQLEKYSASDPDEKLQFNRPKVDRKKKVSEITDTSLISEKRAKFSMSPEEHPKFFDIMKLKDEASQLQLLDLQMRGLKLQNSTNVMLENQKIINSQQQKVNLNENEAKLDTPSDDEENYSETSSLEHLVIKMKPNVDVQLDKYSASVPDEKLQFNRPKVDRKKKVSEITDTSLISEKRAKFSMSPEEHPKVFNIMKLKDEASQLQLLDLQMRGLKLQNSTNVMLENQKIINSRQQKVNLNENEANLDTPSDDEENYSETSSLEQLDIKMKPNVEVQLKKYSASVPDEKLQFNRPKVDRKEKVSEITETSLISEERPKFSMLPEEHPKAFDIMKLKDEASQLQLLDLQMRGLKLQNSTNVMLENQKRINLQQQKVNLNENEAKLDTPSDDEENYSETSSLEQLVIKMKPNVEVQLDKYSASVPNEKVQFNRPKVDRKKKVSEIMETSLISEKEAKFSMPSEKHPKAFDVMKLKDEASQLQLLDLKMRGLKLQNSTKSNQAVANKELNNSAQFFELQIFDDDLDRSEAGHFDKSENKTLSQTNNDERISKLEAAVRGQKNIILRQVSSDSETHKELPASLEEYSNNVMLENQKIIDSQQQKVNLNENEAKLDTSSDDEENYSETSSLEQLVIKMKPNVEVQLKKYSASVPDEKLQFNREITETSLISENRPEFSMSPEEHPKDFDVMKLKDEASQLQLLDLQMKGLKLQNSTKRNQAVANKEFNNAAQYFELQIFEDDLDRPENKAKLGTPSNDEENYLEDHDLRKLKNDFSAMKLIDFQIAQLKLKNAKIKRRQSQMQIEERKLVRENCFENVDEPLQEEFIVLIDDVPDVIEEQEWRETGKELEVEGAKRKNLELESANMTTIDININTASSITPITNAETREKWRQKIDEDVRTLNERIKASFGIFKRKNEQFTSTSKKIRDTISEDFRRKQQELDYKDATFAHIQSLKNLLNIEDSYDELNDEAQIADRINFDKSQLHNDSKADRKKGD